MPMALHVAAEDGPVEDVVDLLFTDVVLPGKNGRVLADEARAERPNLPVLYTTGYSRTQSFIRAAWMQGSN
jgi:CheY-like chemotaxis protein